MLFRSCQLILWHKSTLKTITLPQYRTIRMTETYGRESKKSLEVLLAKKLYLFKVPLICPFDSFRVCRQGPDSAIRMADIRRISAFRLISTICRISAIRIAKSRVQLTWSIWQVSIWMVWSPMTPPPSNLPERSRLYGWFNIHYFLWTYSWIFKLGWHSYSFQSWKPRKDRKRIGSQRIGNE